MDDSNSFEFRYRGCKIHSEIFQCICAKYIAKRKDETRKMAFEKDLAYGVIQTLGGRQKVITKQTFFHCASRPWHVDPTYFQLKIAKLKQKCTFYGTLIWSCETSNVLANWNWLLFIFVVYCFFVFKERPPSEI